MRIIHFLVSPYTVDIYIFKVSNRNTRRRCEICSKLTIKTPASERRYFNFEQVNAGWAAAVFCFQVKRLSRFLK